MIDDFAKEYLHNHLRRIREKFYQGHPPLIRMERRSESDILLTPLVEEPQVTLAAGMQEVGSLFENRPSSHMTGITVM
jgi:hypothetical protein